MRRATRQLGWLAGILVTLCVPHMWAGTIGITTTVSTTVTSNALQVTVSVTNTGDEQAYALHAKIAALGREVDTRKASDFPPGKPIVFRETLPIDVAVPGTSPVIVTVFCTDANQYPFSALAPHVFSHGAAAGTVDLVGKMAAITLSKKGKLELDLKNVSESDIDATIHLIAPQELTVKNDEVKLRLPSRSDRRIQFELKNVSARPGSSYPLVAIIEYEEDGVHQTATAQGTVATTQAKSAFGMSYSALAVLLVSLIAVFIALEKFKK
jgi:hypothetical protein